MGSRERAIAILPGDRGSAFSGNRGFWLCKILALQKSRG
ncbi:hypothetical protein AB434_3287 [Heyndrickxia coagulans]|uniref:Uncharacterized protein n=1 Tax=Heyndrickxia coagulans TaxID=1398 RepID=A0AAN0T604_HEYCO|nr:hypothetical protein SB48_HM08orf03168 [Heyndrickxia coagulans]AKN55692.1 hypothetical protein AB434_3287 [Heyndrickxia coagulans]KYC63960.1 hypothetical protein B4100_3094 [Heyndrickxia coagulans]